jgi:UDP-glucose 4-epimerase
MGGKVLVTGAAGLFGANFTRYLLDRGHEVFGIDDLSGGYEDFLPKHENFTFEKSKIWNDGLLGVYFRHHDIEYVYHFAAHAAAGLSPFVRVSNYENNVMASARLINESIRNNVKKFIFTSSMEIYGRKNPPFSEEDAKSAVPETPYGIAKRTIELDLASAWLYHGLDYAIVRPHNVHGIYQNIWDKYRNVIGIFIRQAIAGEDLIVYGDGQQKRAFSDITYCMEPLYKLLHEHSHKTYNIGADKPYTISELASLVQKVALENGSKVAIRHEEPRLEVKWEQN